MSTGRSIDLPAGMGSRMNKKVRFTAFEIPYLLLHNFAHKAFSIHFGHRMIGVVTLKTMGDN